ncbi:MAG: NAD(P)H-dependent oxidoreductase [Bauldia sp.]
MPKVAVFVGSLRRESINVALARALAKLAGPQLDLELIDISDLPHYNNDLWMILPRRWTRIKRAIEAADAVLFITPEYNRAPPGLMKDVVDWASRPYGKNSWKGKPAAIAGATGGKIGTAVAQSHLRSSLVVLDLALMGQPEVIHNRDAGAD